MNTLIHQLRSLAGLSLCALALAGCNNADYSPLTQSLYVSGAATEPLRTLTIGSEVVASTFYVQAAAPLEQSITVHVEPLQATLDAYNKRYDASYTLLPPEYYRLSTQDLVIEAGRVISPELSVTILPFSEEMKRSGRKYALPLEITSVQGDDLHLLQGEKSLIFALDQVIVTKALMLARNQTVEIASLPEPVQSNSWTMEMRVKSDDIRPSFNNQAFAEVTSGVEGGGEGSGFIYGRWEGDLIQFKVNGHDGINAAVKPESNKWYHIALVCNNGTLSLYVNGQLSSSESNAKFAVVGQYQNFKFAYVNEWRRSSFFYSEVRFWKRALTANQIRANRFAVDPQSPDLVSYWKFDELTDGHIIKDVSGRGVDLHLSTPGEANPTYTLVDIRSDQD